MSEELINFQNVDASELHEQPFVHCVIDNFFCDDIAERLEEEFPSFNSDLWHRYRNPLEVKNACNNWNCFPPLTYQTFKYLNSQSFCNVIRRKLNFHDNVYSDEGLNGGGWHISGNGGKLNPHLDYFIHPKLNLQRKFNLIIYLNSIWGSSWGGHFGLWESNANARRAGKMIKSIFPKFNRAIIFETSNSWHGLSNQINCPPDHFRKSLAVYFLCEPPTNFDNPRHKALYSPTEEQKDDPKILSLINKRASATTANQVWKV